MKQDWTHRYTKREAGYRRTHGPRTCDRCRFYVDAGRTGQCTLVYGMILPEDTCDLWKPERGIIKHGRRVLPLDMFRRMAPRFDV